MIRPHRSSLSSSCLPRLLLSAAVLVLAERKVMALMQQRYGPLPGRAARLLQPFADILKLLFKEELRPKAPTSGSSRWRP